MSQRFRRLLALTAMCLAVPIPRIAAANASGTGQAPLLWSGRIVDRHGEPSAAHVTAFLRPPASAIPTAESNGPAPASVPLASSIAGPDGRFDLRAALPGDVPLAYHPDGWFHVMVLAESAEGSWAPSTPLALGAWVSTSAGEDRVRAALSDREPPNAASLARLITEDLTGGAERPDVLQLGEPRITAAGTGPASGRWKGPGDPYIGCNALAVEGREESFRTISDIDVGPAWSYVLSYTDTKTTSWDIGVEQSGGQWKAGGTTSFSNSRDRGFDSEYGPYPGRFRESYQVQLVHAKVLWRCASRRSPGPFYIRTVEPESWTGGTFNQGEPIVPCNPRNRKPVAGNTTGWRREGKTSKYSASAAGFGFSGQAEVGYSREVKLGWRNHLGHPRDVCGESGNPFEGRTRVAAMDEHRA
jgi:hypothetical protein